MDDHRDPFVRTILIAIVVIVAVVALGALIVMSAFQGSGGVG